MLVPIIDIPGGGILALDCLLHASILFVFPWKSSGLNSLSIIFLTTFWSSITAPLATKEYLSSKNISYQDIDVSSDRQALEEMTKISGQMGVPVIVINGEAIIGFDKARIDSLLAT